MNELTAESIRDFIATNFLPQAQQLSVDDDLLDLLDSLQVLRLITELERNHGLKIANSDMTPENLGSASRLAAFAATKL